MEVHEALTALHGSTEGSDVVMKSISHVHQHEGDGPRLEQAGGRRASEAPPDHNNPHGIVHGHPGSHRTALKPGRGDQTRVNPAQPSRAADSRGLAPWSWGGGPDPSSSSFSSFSSSSLSASPRGGWSHVCRLTSKLLATAKL